MLYACMCASMYACMYVWMDGWINGWMDGWMDVWVQYSVKWLQMTQVRQSHLLQTCHGVRESASDAAEGHAQSMSPSTTPTT